MWVFRGQLEKYTHVDVIKFNVQAMLTMEFPFMLNRKWTTGVKMKYFFKMDKYFNEWWD